MTRKQLAEMIKSLRKKAALKEVIGKPGPFRPVHVKTKDEPADSPNQYVHRMAEEALDEQRSTLGPRRARKQTKWKMTLGALEKRNWGGNQSMKKRYTEEEVEKLGATDTGQKTKSTQDTVDINPTITSGQGETTKNNNTTIKERKEK